MALLQDPAFWLAVGQIILIDILLGGDNAIVIALACRGLPEHQRRQGIFWGTMGAIVIRIGLIGVALTLLGIPFLKLVGAALLVWIGVKLLTEEDDNHEVDASEKLWGAIKTIVLADLIMSVDNVIGVTAAAEAGGGDHKLTLVVFGLLVSIPVVVWGSTFVIRLMDKFPWVIIVGGMLMGWIAGTMAVTDPAVLGFVPIAELPGGSPKVANWFYQTSGVVGAALVFLLSRIKKRYASDKETDPNTSP
jgi:YjbE family integral membrane protein